MDHSLIANLQELADELNTPQARQAQREYELGKYTTQELKDELESRGASVDIELFDVCDHGFEMGYCPVKKCEGGY